jgi:hypothetical protein
MPLFKCEKCGDVENTALCGYWWKKCNDEPLLCSECDPEIGKWHGEFTKRGAGGLMLGEDGFLYSAEQPPRHTKLIGPA